MGEKKEKEDVEQATNSSIERILARKTFQYRQVKMACQNLLFPYLHLEKNYTTASFKFQLPFPKDAWSRKEMMGKVSQQEHSPAEWYPGLVQSGQGVMQEMGKSWEWGGRGWEGIIWAQAGLCVHLSFPSGLPLQVFAEDWLASLLLYMPCSFYPFQNWIFMPPGFVFDSTRKKKVMPNHLEDIKCQQAKGWGIICYLYFYCTLLLFLSSSVKKKKNRILNNCCF